MKSLRVLVVCAIAVVPLHAQTSVVVRPSPDPNQKTAVTTVQELSISATGALGGGLAADGPGSVQIASKGTLAFTQANASYNDKGQLDAQLTITHLEMTQTVNGKADTARDTAAATGHSMTATFDRQGHMLDVKLQPELKQVATTVRQLLGGAYGIVNSLPEAPMKVGDTYTGSGVIPLRLPGTSDGSPLQTRAIVTLRRIETGPKGRIAHLDERIESDGTTGRFVVAGKGTIEVNLDKGFIASSAMTWKLTGTMTPAASPGTPSSQSAQVEATFTMMLTASESP